MTDTALSPSGRPPRHFDSVKRDAILQATVELLDEHGDGGVRLRQIAERADVSIGLIGHHFGKRTELIKEAQLARFALLAKHDSSYLHESIGAAGTEREFAQAIDALVEDALSAARTEHRLARAVIIAQAHGSAATGSGDGDEALLVGMGAEIDELIGPFQQSIEAAQRNGFITTDLSARAIATFLLSATFGLILSDLACTCGDEKELAAAMTAAIGGFLT